MGISAASTEWTTRSIGAEANLAARLQSIAEPGHIVISYETHALVRGMITAHTLPAITMKGISREVVPFAVEGITDAAGGKTEIISEHLTGLDLYLDPTRVETGGTEQIRSIFRRALAALEKKLVTSDGASAN